MDLLTLIILVIVCGIGILLVFRAITFVIRILSVIALLVAILCVAGSYFMAQAYILPEMHTSYVTLTTDGGFVMSQTKTQPLELDSAATAAFSRTFIKSIRELNVSSYRELKNFAKDDIFKTADTVWVVNAINKTGCTQERIITNSKAFTTLCLDAKAAQKPSSIQLKTQLQSLIDVSALNRVPIKASFWQWIKNYVFS